MTELAIKGRVVKRRNVAVTRYKGFPKVQIYLGKDFPWLGEPEYFEMLFVEAEGEKFIVLKPKKKEGQPAGEGEI